MRRRAPRQHDLNQRKLPAPRQRVLQGVLEFASRLDPLAMTTERRRERREPPVVEVVEARFRLKHAQHFPALVVEQYDDWIEAVTAAVAELPTGHLKRAVADQDQRGPAGRGRHPPAPGDPAAPAR